MRTTTLHSQFQNVSFIRHWDSPVTKRKQISTLARGFVGSLKNAFEKVPSLSTKSRLPFKTLRENHASNDVSSAPYHVTLLFRRASPQETDSGSEHEYRDAFDIRRAG